MNEGLLVTVDALDGVGKTTLVRALADRLGGVAMDTPGPELRAVRAEVLAALGDEQTARCLFYAASVLSRGREARRLADAGRVVVVDRYWPSTLSYARARGVTADLSGIERVVPRADVAVLLTLDEAERRRRLLTRGVLTPADLETFDLQFRAVVLTELRRMTDVEVDLTGADACEAVDRVVAALAEQRGCDVERSSCNGPERSAFARRS